MFVNGVDLSQKPELEYIEIFLESRAFNGSGRQFFALVDYGQLIRFPADNGKHRLQDKTGTDYKFNSEIEVFNLLHKESWLYQSTYVLGESYRYHIFKRKP